GSALILVNQCHLPPIQTPPTISPSPRLGKNMATSSDKARGDKSLRKDYSEGAWQLMVAAEKLFGRHGIEAVSLREIAATANHANSSAVQYHFGSKENLVQAVFEMRMPKLEAARAQHLTNARSMGKL